MLVERQDLHLCGRDSLVKVGSGVMQSGRISSRILADKEEVRETGLEVVLSESS